MADAVVYVDGFDPFRQRTGAVLRCDGHGVQGRRRETGA